MLSCSFDRKGPKDKRTVLHVSNSQSTVILERCKITILLLLSYCFLQLVKVWLDHLPASTSVCLNRFLVLKTRPTENSIGFILNQDVQNVAYNTLTVKCKYHTVFENHRKGLIQHCERSELRLHFERTKVNLKMPKMLNLKM